MIFDVILIALFSIVFGFIIYSRMIERAVVVYLYRQQTNKPREPWYDSDVDGPRFH